MKPLNFEVTGDGRQLGLKNEAGTVVKQSPLPHGDQKVTTTQLTHNVMDGKGFWDGHEDVHHIAAEAHHRANSC